MNDGIYTAQACFPDGEVIKLEGTLADISYWADNIIRGKGACNIEIRIKSKKKKAKKEVEV